MHLVPITHRLRRLARPGALNAAVALAATFGIPSEARAQACVPENCLPPPNSAYATASIFNFNFLGTTFDLDDLNLHDFTLCGPPPPSSPGASTTLQFDAAADFAASVNGGAPTPGQVLAHWTMLVRFNHQSGSTLFFDTEILQLQLSGATLPLGAMIRESPTLASVGQTTIESLGGGNFRIDSFFDVFFELSLNGGISWVPELNGPGLLTLAGPGCPTSNRASSWGSVKVIYR